MSTPPKHQAFFLTKEDLESTPKPKIKEIPKSNTDLSTESSVLPDGTPNFRCPCLGNLPHGPCGELFKDSFSCWAKYKDEPEDSEHFYLNCTPKFKLWGQCTDRYEKLYEDPGKFNRPSNIVFKDTRGKVDIKKIVMETSTSSSGSGIKLNQGTN